MLLEPIVKIELPAVVVDYPGAVTPGMAASGWDYETYLKPLWNDREGEAVAPPPEMTVSEWADERRVLQAGISRKPGPWRTDYTPYLRDFMDAYALPHVRNLVLCAGTQLGKTESVYNILGYIIDYDPYPTLLMMPREDDAKLISNTRLQPMIRDCESLRAKMPKRRSEFKTLEMQFPGMALYLVGANSLAALSSKPCRNVIRDEGDKYPEKIGDGDDPDAKSEERAKSFWDIRKIIDVSSPSVENKGIIAKLRKCSVIRVMHHPCPHCQRLIRLSYQQIKYRDEKDHPHRLMLAKKSAVYFCQECGSEIKNEHRPWMIANYQYVDQIDIGFGEKEAHRNIPLGDIDFEPESIGFWVSSLSSPMLTWGDVVEAMLKALIHRDETGELGRLKTVINDWLAEPWRESVKKSSVDLILAKRGEREPLVVPEWAVALTGGIDVQKYGFWFTVWAWSKSMQSAMIHYGHLVTWDDVYKMVFDTTFPVEGGGREMAIWRAAMDIGGGKESQLGEDWTKTEEILTWIRDNGQGVVFAVKGMSRNSTGQKIRHTVLDKMPGEKGGLIPGGLSLWLLDTDQLKDNVMWRFENKEIDPQPLELHREVGEDYALQLTAEEKQMSKNGTWSWVQVRRDNHLLDATVYGHAAADFQWLGGVKILNEAQYREAERGGRLSLESGGDRERPGDIRRPSWLQERRR